MFKSVKPTPRLLESVMVDIVSVIFAGVMWFTPSPYISMVDDWEISTYEGLFLLESKWDSFLGRECA